LQIQIAVGESKVIRPRQKSGGPFPMQISVSVLCASLFAAAALAFSQSPDAPQPVRERDWKEVLGPSRGTWTNPRPKLQWLEDFDEAKAIAAREGRPD
jgi:hypothetical protein